jgi:tetratricopeptide (TPR) repeat protein
MISENTAQTDAKEMLEAARDHFRDGNYAVAESLLAQLLLHDGRNAEIFHMLATIYYDQGKFNKAIKTFRRALEIDPAYTDASVGLSIILNDLGKYDEGKKVFMEAQEILDRKKAEGDPFVQERFATKHDELGEMYFQHKRYGDALDEWQKALAISSRKADLRMKAVECYVQMEDGASAIRELKALAQEFPHFVPARLKLGLLYYNAHKVIEAIEQWEAVLARDPEHPAAIKYLQMAQESGSTLIL